MENQLAEMPYFKSVLAYKKLEHGAVGIIPYPEGKPEIWGQKKAKTSSVVKKMAKYHDCHDVDALTRKMVHHAGRVITDVPVLVITKGARTDLMGELMETPTMDPKFRTFTARTPFAVVHTWMLTECPIAMPMHIVKDGVPNNLRTQTRWQPRIGMILSSDLRNSEHCTRNQQAGYTMSLVELQTLGVAAGTDDSGRRLVGYQMQRHKEPDATKEIQISDTVMIAIPQIAV